MMKHQTPEFLLGYLFNEIERKIIKEISGRDNYCTPDKPDTYTAQIPLLWFGITRPNSSYHINSMVECICEDLVKKLDETLLDIFTKRKIKTVFFSDGQYMKFVTTAVVDRRILTVSQIENLLGYKITIVPEETK